MLVLEVIKGASPRTRFELAGPLVSIGRAATNAVALSDYHLSGEHGQVVRDDGGWTYRDLRSTNGSAVERRGTRRPVDAACGHQVALEPDDLLLLGDPRNPVVLRVRLEADDRAGAGPDADDDLGDRLIASRSIIDLPAVTDQLEHDPAGALQVYKVLQRLGGRPDLAATLEACVEAAFELLPRATHAAVLLRAEGERDRFVLASSCERLPDGRLRDLRRERGGAGAAAPDPVRASRTILRRVLADRAALLMANASEELSSSESVLGGRILSMLAIPLWRGDEIIGLLQVDNRRSAGMFDEAVLEIALLLGSQAALAIDNATLIGRLRVAEDRLRGENGYLKRKDDRGRFQDIVGESTAMRAVFAQLEKVVDTRVTVCILGETGTGKELVASAIHHRSGRRDKMFVAQNCAALPENLLESELFGHKRGAFTSADADKKGLFEIADGGTLFLDEVGEMPLALQAKLLRVLQEGTIRPVGATAEKHVDVRIVCATNRDLAAEVQQGRFRQDLYYRLVVFPIQLPPLRERRDDIPLLAAHFLRRYAGEYRAELPGFTPGALDALAGYAWPGNIRELENEVQRLVIQAEPGCWIDVADLSPRMRQTDGTLARVAPRKGTLREMMEQVERALLIEALREHDNNKTRTAATLGITREGLHKKLAKIGL